MELTKLFAQASQKLLLEFETSAAFHHPGSTGSYREDALKAFLAKRLPQRYHIGNGHVLGPIVNESKQLDCVIVDNNVCPALVVSESLQYFPVEGVVGAIEVKSQLTKAKLLEGLENIESFKALVPRDTVERHVGGYGSGFFSYDLRPMPFGIVFAYSLGDNSLESLADNLREWELDHDPASGANAIVVLDQGIIFHMLPGFRNAILTEDIKIGSQVFALQHKHNTLFEFYLILMRLISTISLGSVQWEAYRKPAQRIRGHIVKGGSGFTKPGDSNTYVVSGSFIEKILAWAKGAEKVSLISVLQQGIGSLVPDGIKDRKLYFYNPENLPGLQSLPSGSISSSGVISTRSSIPHFQLVIDNEEFLIPNAYLSDSDLEAIEGSSGSK